MKNTIKFAVHDSASIYMDIYNWISAQQLRRRFALLTCTQPTYQSPIHNDLGVLKFATLAY